MHKNYSNGHVVLVTGLPTMGKSTLCELFREKGIMAVDGDDPTIMKRGSRWDRRRMKGLLRENRELYVFGVAVNTPAFLHLFNEIYYIRGDRSIMQERLDRKDLEAFGKTRGERKVLFAAVRVINLAAGAASKASRKFRILDPHMSPEQLFGEIRRNRAAD